MYYFQYMISLSCVIGLFQIKRHIAVRYFLWLKACPISESNVASGSNVDFSFI